MTQHRDFATGNVFPAGFTDAIEEYVSTLASANFEVVRASATSLKVAASAGNGQVTIGIQGAFRYNTADATATHPGGGAGSYDVYVTSRVNNTTQEDAGTFDYSFGLKIGAPSGSGSEAISRKVATLTWDGAAITAVQQLVGEIDTHPISPTSDAATTGGITPLQVRGRTGGTQTADLATFESTPGTVVAAITAAGRLSFGASTDAQLYRSNSAEITSNATLIASALTSSGTLTAAGDLAHTGTKVGFYGTAAVTKQTGWTAFTGASVRRTIGSSYTMDQLRDCVDTLRADLVRLGLLGT